MPRNIRRPSGVLTLDMTIFGRFHPLFVHFPVGLVLAAAAFEILAVLTRRVAWRWLAIANLRAGALSALVTAAAGWALASSGIGEPGPTLEWHRWIGALGSALTLAAAIAAGRLDGNQPRPRRLYQGTLFLAAGLIAAAGHLGAALVWGADFLSGS